MGIETERKFVVTGEGWRAAAAPGVAYRQGYLLAAAGRTVRVRTAGEAGYLTIKGPRTGLSRAEYEYAIPYADAVEMLATLCPAPLVEKVRHEVWVAGRRWEVDVFGGLNAPLVLAEVELAAEAEAAAVVVPAWAGPEVSTDRRYTNAYLAEHPFSTWGR